MPRLSSTAFRGAGWRTWSRILAFSLMSSLGCSGCYQPAVVPPTASIPHPMVGPTPPIQSTPAPIAPPAPVVTPSLTPPPSIEAWKPQTTPRDWKYIVLHHTATDSGDVQSIHEAHLKNKDKSGKSWLGIGYHFVIGNGNGMGDGEIEPTFRWKDQMHGAHAGKSEYNQQGIGIVLVGNFEDHPPTAAQVAAVKHLVASLAGEYKIASDRVIGHGDVKATECPGKLFPLSEVQASLASYLAPGLYRATFPAPFSRN